ncbi:hypothetical protein K8R78_00885 [bacterium]|nr:hypothetical protein [bacterium]
MEIAALVASIVSVIVALIAIALAIIFFILATKQSQQIRNVEKDISSSVEKLEELFNVMYADAMGIVKASHSSLLDKVGWGGSKKSEEDIKVEENRIEEKFSKLQSEMTSVLMRKVGSFEVKNDKNMAMIRTELDKMVQKTIEDTRVIENEMSEKNLRHSVMMAIRKISSRSGTATADKVVNVLGNTYGAFAIRKELYRMYRRDEIVSEDSLTGFHDIMPETSFALSKNMPYMIEE